MENHLRVNGREEESGRLVQYSLCHGRARLWRNYLHLKSQIKAITGSCNYRYMVLQFLLLRQAVQVPCLTAQYAAQEVIRTWVCAQSLDIKPTVRTLLHVHRCAGDRCARYRFARDRCACDRCARDRCARDRCACDRSARDTLHN